MELIRLRIEIDSVDPLFSIGTTRFWYMLDKSHLGTIQAFRRHLMSRICSIMALNTANMKLPAYSSVKLSMDGFELPCQESSNLLRNRDKVM